MVRFMFYKDLSGHNVENRFCRREREGSRENMEITSRKLFKGPREK